MRRAIVGFEQDDQGDWVAQLDCLHRQHVRHDPPLWPRPWVTTAEGRAERIGTDLQCPLCDRVELPAELHVVRSAQWDDASFPAALRRDHQVAAGVWGRLRVLEGEVHLTIATEPPVDRVLHAGDEQAIPPQVLHAAVPGSSTVVVLDFLRRDPDPGG